MRLKIMSSVGLAVAVIALTGCEYVPWQIPQPVPRMPAQVNGAPTPVPTTATTP